MNIRPRQGSPAVCSGCGQQGPGYDTLAPRHFHFVPVWAIPVILVYSMRRVDCHRCGVTVEQVPWGDGKRQLTRAYAVFLSRWARRLSWKEVATIFNVSWDKVYRSVAWVVEYGLQHRSLDGVTAIGVDEVPVPERASLLDCRLSDQRRMSTATVGWAGSFNQNTTTFFQDAGRRANSSYPVRL